jgi:hypothetical protein
MKVVQYSTRISRKKLSMYSHEPDETSVRTIELVRETTEGYYQPAVAILDAIYREVSSREGTTSKQHHGSQKPAGLYQTRQSS